ncbi:hypothetical protein HanIR_Chr13g0664201 [Helianthus annuus]|nr:hypothetical protein HanIR_Chr13g0664201 [Helianthus annuus]
MMPELLLDVLLFQAYKKTLSLHFLNDRHELASVYLLCACIYLFIYLFNRGGNCVA